MFTLRDFQADYLDYAARTRLWEFLQASHAEEDLNELMLRILEGEEKIMQSFGLPSTQCHSSLLHLASLNPHFGLSDIEALYGELQERADRYLSGNVLSDLQLLEMAQKWGLQSYEVLPQTSLKLQAEPYYHFLYVEYFLPGHLSAQSFLEEIRIVAKNKLATQIYVLTINLQWKDCRDYALLSEYGLVYLDEFLEGYADFIKESEMRKDLIDG